MAVDHAEWLRKQGVRITGRHTLRRAPARGYMNWDSKLDSDRIDFTTTEEQVYQVELDERTIERLERIESTVKHAVDYCHSRHVPGSKYATYDSTNITDFFLENRERHNALLKENSMYRDAWKEFQSIRALLGETPHWP